VARKAIAQPTGGTLSRVIAVLDEKIAAASSVQEIRELVALRGITISQDPQVQEDARRTRLETWGLVVDSLFRAASFLSGFYLVLFVTELRRLGALFMAIGIFHVAPRLIQRWLSALMRGG
jgi:hypothetical protein